ncbi:unnamed protein product [Phyllotreta striolata]|uniref:Uncharacterized protein n=1 Tax=Phyllotreta striolata TaxID=444603 RepID=A0A9N9TSJ0_PHYSR|nr:unnamed protein product [Phyllotreta striolata]
MSEEHGEIPGSLYSAYSIHPKEDPQNTGHFRLPAHKMILPVAQGSNGHKSKHSPYIVKNYGLTDISIDLIYGTKDQVGGVLQSVVVKPDEEVNLNPGEEAYEHTALKVYNRSDEPANFSVDGGISVFDVGSFQEDVPISI